MLQRARCHMETKEWEAAVRIFERMNNRWEVGVTLKPGDLLFCLFLHSYNLIIGTGTISRARRRPGRRP